MKTGIVGLGLRAANVLKMLIEDLPELDLVGYVDPDPCGLSLLDNVPHNLIKNSKRFKKISLNQNFTKY